MEEKRNWHERGGAKRNKNKKKKKSHTLKEKRADIRFLNRKSSHHFDI